MLVDSKLCVRLNRQQERAGLLHNQGLLKKKKKKLLAICLSGNSQEVWFLPVTFSCSYCKCTIIPSITERDVFSIDSIEFNTKFI